MADENKSGLSEAMEKGSNAAHAIKGAVKTGKAISDIAKGASAGGPYGAVAGALWANRKTVGKAIAAASFLLMLPILFIMMLPSLIFGGLNAETEIPVMNDDVAIYANITSAEGIVSKILQEQHDSVVAKINAEISNFGENKTGTITDDYASGAPFNNFMLISQYSASKDYAEINLNDFKRVIESKKDGLFTYTSETSSTTDDEGVTHTTVAYTVVYVGEAHFTEAFALDAEQTNLAFDYAENLTLHIYGTPSFLPGANVSPEVLAHAEAIAKYAEKYGIKQFINVIYAVMMQESGGRGLDPMQCSECPLNTKYPVRPNGITDPDYSIEVGIHYLAGCLSDAGCTSPADVSKLSLALQGYNYGGGYIGWAKSNYGGYTAANAKEFSEKKKRELGWSGYGDPEYVPHVMRYLRALTVEGGSEGWGNPFPGADWRTRITSEFGTRVDPVTKVPGAFHTGLDFGYGYGTLIYPIKPGVVKSVTYGSTGYGYHVIIDHGGGYETLYGHCSALLVSAGQQVTTATPIGKVGSTGKSTGNHLHLEIRVNGSAVNPRTYIN